MTDTQIIVKYSTEDYIYEVSSNKNGELYVMKIDIKISFGIDKYKILDSKAYPMDKALDYHDETGDIFGQISRR